MSVLRLREGALKPQRAGVFVKLKQITVTDCPVCGKALRAGSGHIHRRCQRVLRRELRERRSGEVRQLRFVLPDGAMAPRFFWGAPPLKELVKAPEVRERVVKAPEEYPHTPGKCGFCGERVRNKERAFHRQCLAYLQDPTPPPSPKAPPQHYPAARWCETCRRLDNSLYPAQFCRQCGRETQERRPDK